MDVVRCLFRWSRLVAEFSLPFLKPFPAPGNKNNSNSTAAEGFHMTLGGVKGHWTKYFISKSFSTNARPDYQEGPKTGLDGTGMH